MSELPASRWYAVRRRRVSLAGHLRRSDGEAAGGGQVCGSSPDARSESASFHREAVVRPDGLYFFLDLPAGTWLLSGLDSFGANLGLRSVDVPPPDRTRRPTMLAVDLVVTSTPSADQEQASP